MYLVEDVLCLVPTIGSAKPCSVVLAAGARVVMQLHKSGAKVTSVSMNPGGGARVVLTAGEGVSGGQL